MGQNKQQKEAAERAKKEAPQPQPTTPAPVAPAVQAQAPTKQQVTLAKLEAAWTERKVDLSKMEAKQDGKFLIVKVAVNWPTIRIGPSGGGDILELKSYAKFFEAAIVADDLLAKQVGRQQKKAATSAPAPAKPVAAKPEVRKESPALRKQKADQKLEQQLQQA
jgi:hypothetical protein